MGLTTPHGIGREETFFAIEESTYGTLQAASATDAAKILKSEMDFKQMRDERLDKRSTLGLRERITARKEGTWSVRAYLIGSGSAGTPPDLHPLYKNAFGSYTNTPATSDAYAMSSTQTDKSGLTLTRHLGGMYQEAAVGCWIDKVSFELSGTSHPEVTFEGGGKDIVRTGYTTLDGAVATSATTMDVDQPDNLHAGSIVKIGDDDNSGAGYRVTGVSGSTVTFTPGLAGAGESDAEPVIPLQLSETTAGSPVSGILGSIDLDADTSIPWTAATIEAAFGAQPHNDEGAQDSTTDVTFGDRRVTGSLTVKLRRDELLHLTRVKTFTLADLQLVAGTAAGNIWTFDLPTVELEFAPVDFPEGAEVATFQLPFTALESSGDDEFTLTVT